MVAGARPAERRDERLHHHQAAHPAAEQRGDAQGEKAAVVDADDVDRIRRHLVQRAGDRPGGALQIGTRDRGAAPVPWQVQRDHLAPGGNQVRHGGGERPGRPAESVQQQ